MSSHDDNQNTKVQPLKVKLVFSHLGAGARERMNAIIHH